MRARVSRPAEDGWRTIVARKPRFTGDREENPPTALKHPPPPDATSYLLTNLPGNCTAATLWRRCCQLGTLKDAFIPNRRDRRGQIYGFVRFVGIRNHDAMVDKLNRIKIGNSNHIAKLARTQKSHTTSHPPPPPPPSRNPPPPPPHNPPYPKTRPDNIWAPRQTVRNMSYKDVIKGHSQYVEIQIPCTPPLVPTTWKTSMLVGETTNIHHLLGANTLLTEDTTAVPKIHYIGGLRLLLKFDCSMDAKDFLMNKKPTWSKIFKNLAIWEGQHVKYDRIAKLFIRGIPFHLRCKDTLEAIGKAFGRVIMSDDFDWSSYELESGTCYILTEKVSSIEGMVKLCWNKKYYDVWVCENPMQWSPHPDLPSPSPSSDSSDNDSDCFSSEQGPVNLEEGEFIPNFLSTPPKTISEDGPITTPSLKIAPTPATADEEAAAFNYPTPFPDVHCYPTLDIQTSPSLTRSSKQSPRTPSPPPSPLAPPPPYPNIHYPTSPSQVEESNFLDPDPVDPVDSIGSTLAQDTPQMGRPNPPVPHNTYEPSPVPSPHFIRPIPHHSPPTTSPPRHSSLPQISSLTKAASCPTFFPRLHSSSAVPMDNNPELPDLNCTAKASSSYASQVSLKKLKEKED
ncbi:hypothetical protein SSX86_024603 [Deinandra increscens subsp. villosa]|uniref:RRM domain-containing protein n=1 Tax=Deinandra increscens subsp. villosa TaxID=3103831 RepID=A0AAP0CHW3_9ASTR